MSLTPISSNSISNVSDATSLGLAVDPTALESLRAQANKDPKSVIKAVASQFEALFMNTLMKQMRETSFDDSENSSEMNTYRSMLDEQMVQTMSRAGGVGLGDMLARQIARIANVDGGTGGANQLVHSVPTEYVPPSFNRALQAYQAHSKDAASSGADSSGLPTSQQDFIETLLPQAQSAASKLGVAPELLVAHAALETGWGRKTINGQNGRNSFNLFGVKAGSNWNGETVNVLTTEYENGVPQKRVDTFRAYGSYQQAFEDYAQMLSSNPRYKGALNQGGNATSFASGLQRGGYATDPAYVRKLNDVAASVTSKLGSHASSFLVAGR